MSKRFNLGRAARTLAERVAKRAHRIWQSPEKRDRVKMHLAFALIFAFVVSGTDYVVTGGPEWNPGGEAYAMEMPQSQTRADLVVRAGPLPPTQQADAKELEEIPAIDYSFTTEALLGGPEMVLAENEPAANGGVSDGKPDALEPLEIETGKSKDS